MILRFFKTNQPVAAIAIPFVVVVLWLPCLFHTAISDLQDGMPVYQWILALIQHLPPLLIKLLCIAIVSLQAIYIHYIVVKHEVLYKDSYLPSLMFVVVASCLPAFQQFSPMLLVNLLMLFILNKTFALFKEEFPMPLIFDSCFLIAIASLIYLPAILLFLLFLISLLVLRPFHWREWIVSFIGFGLPYFFISVYFFWIDGLKQFYSQLFTRHFNLRLFYEIHFTKPLTLLIILFGGLLLLSLFKLRDNFYKNAIKTRIVQQVIIIYLIMATIATLTQTVITLQPFVLLAFPVAIFFAYFFLSVTKRLWIYEVFFLIMLAIVFANLI